MSNPEVKSYAVSLTSDTRTSPAARAVRCDACDRRPVGFRNDQSSDRDFFARETGWLDFDRKISAKKHEVGVLPREKNGRRVRQKIRDATRAPARRGDTPRRRVRGHSQRRGVSTDEGERVASRTAEKFRDASRRKSLAPRRRDIRLSGTRHRGERLCGKADEDVRAGSASAPRDASSECSSSSSDATRPRPARAGRGPRAGRTHRLASRARVPTGPDGNEENAPPVFVCAFSEPKPSAPRPPADAERSALLRAVRDAEEEASGSCNRDSARRRKARDGNGKARRFGAAFDGNRPRTPPPPTETEGARRKKNAFLRRRAATRFSPRGAAGADANRGRPVRGGGGTGVDVENGEANVCDAVPGMEAVPARGSQTLWAPGGSAYVRAWGASTEEPSSFAARSSVPRESSSASSSRSGSRACSARDPFKVVPIPTQKLGQRTALAIDALRSTRRRAWSADVAVRGEPRRNCGTLPPRRAARRKLFLST